MPYNLIMSPAQIARCNRALGSDVLSMQLVSRTWDGVTTQEEVVVLDRAGIRGVISALRERPEAGDHYRSEDFQQMSIEAWDLANIADTLELVLNEDEDPNMLHGIRL